MLGRAHVLLVPAGRYPGRPAGVPGGAGHQEHGAPMAGRGVQRGQRTVGGGLGVVDGSDAAKESHGRGIPVADGVEYRGRILAASVAVCAVLHHARHAGSGHWRAGLGQHEHPGPRVQTGHSQEPRVLGHVSHGAVRFLTGSPAGGCIAVASAVDLRHQCHPHGSLRCGCVFHHPPAASCCRRSRQGSALAAPVRLHRGALRRGRMCMSAVRAHAGVRHVVVAVHVRPGRGRDPGPGGPVLRRGPGCTTTDPDSTVEDEGIHAADDCVLPRVWVVFRGVAVLRHPVLAAHSACHTHSRGPVSHPECNCRRAGNMGGQSHPAHTTRSLHLHHGHDRLHHGPGILPPTDPQHHLLGIISTGRGIGNLRTRPGLCSRVHLHHQQRGAVIPRQRGQSAGHEPESLVGDPDQYRGRHRGKGGHGPDGRDRTAGTAGDLVVCAGDAVVRGAGDGDLGTDSKGGGKGACYLIVWVSLVHYVHFVVVITNSINIIAHPHAPLTSVQEDDSP